MNPKITVRACCPCGWLCHAEGGPACSPACTAHDPSPAPMGPDEATRRWRQRRRARLMRRREQSWIERDMAAYGLVVLFFAAVMLALYCP